MEDDEALNFDHSVLVFGMPFKRTKLLYLLTLLWCVFVLFRKKHGLVIFGKID